MKNEFFEEVFNNLKINKNDWVQLCEIESIVLKDGVGIYPNWKHHRFKILDDRILIQHGYSVPYGARLNNIFSIGYGNMSLQFPPGNVIQPTIYYADFRYPKKGDILVVSTGINKISSQSIISNVINSSNCFCIELGNPIQTSPDMHLSFYDPGEYDPHFAMHANQVEGIYMNFIPNDGKTNKYGLYHQVIMAKEINEILLSLSVASKTYSLKQEGR